MDGDQADDDEQNHLRDEGRALQVVVRAFFKIHHAQTTDDQNQDGGYAVDGVVDLNFSRGSQC